MNTFLKKNLEVFALAISSITLTVTASAYDFQPHPGQTPPAWAQPMPNTPVSGNSGGGWARPTPGDLRGGGVGMVGGYEGNHGSIYGWYSQP